MRITGTDANVRAYVDDGLSRAQESAFPLRWSAKNGTEHEWVGDRLERENACGIVPLSPTDAWWTVSLAAKEKKPRQLLGIFPTYLQLEPRFVRQMKELGMSAFCVQEERAQAGLSMAGELSVDGIVLTLPALDEAQRALRAVGRAAYLQVVLGVHERPRAQSREEAVRYEMHLVAGMPGFYQCAHLAGSLDTFHPSDRFVWEQEGTGLWVTDPERRFVRARLPQRTLAQELPCPCGTSARIVLV